MLWVLFFISLIEVKFTYKMCSSWTSFDSCMLLCNPHHRDPDTENFHHPDFPQASLWSVPPQRCLTEDGGCLHPPLNSRQLLISVSID